MGSIDEKVIHREEAASRCGVSGLSVVARLRLSISASAITYHRNKISTAGSCSFYNPRSNSLSKPCR